MATGQAMIDRARRLGYVDSAQYSDSQATEDMNIIYHDIENTIVTEVDEDFFWNIFTADLVAGQNEYTLPSETIGNFSGLFKLKSVSAKLASTASFTKLEMRYPYELSNDLSYYETSGDQFYYISDNSIFIYPKPTENITGGLKLYGVQNLIDISKDTTEANIFNGKIPSKFHHLVPLGMLEYIFKGTGRPNEAIAAKNEYILEKSKLVEYLSDRNSSIIIGDLPNLSYLSN